MLLSVNSLFWSLVIALGYRGSQWSKRRKVVANDGVSDGYSSDSSHINFWWMGFKETRFQSFSRMMSKDDAGASWMHLLLYFLKIGCSLPIELSNNLQWEFLCGSQVEGGVCGLWVFYWMKEKWIKYIIKRRWCFL